MPSIIRRTPPSALVIGVYALLVLFALLAICYPV